MYCLEIQWSLHCEKQCEHTDKQKETEFWGIHPTKGSHKIERYSAVSISAKNLKENYSHRLMILLRVPVPCRLSSPLGTTATVPWPPLVHLSALQPELFPPTYFSLIPTHKPPRFWSSNCSSFLQLFSGLSLRLLARDNYYSSSQASIRKARCFFVLFYLCVASMAPTALLQFCLPTPLMFVLVVGWGVGQCWEHVFLPWTWAAVLAKFHMSYLRLASVTFLLLPNCHPRLKWVFNVFLLNLLHNFFIFFNHFCADIKGLFI